MRWFNSRCRGQGVFLAAALLSCSESALLSGVGHVGYPELRLRITESAGRNELLPADVRKLAKAVAQMEIERAQGAQGSERVARFRGCTRPLVAPLKERAQKNDQVAVTSALMLIESGELGAECVKGRAEEALQEGGPDGPRFRALVARSLVDEDSFDHRRSLFRDGDEDVRAAALSAAIEAPASEDELLLLEVARVDPAPVCRGLALRALGKSESEKVVVALRDLWVTADDVDRQGIVDAWSSEGLRIRGGENELVRILESEQGAPAIAAALALSTTGPHRETALLALVRFIASGPPRDRLFVIGMAPLSDARIYAEVVKAGQDPNEGVRVAALERRLAALSLGEPLGNPEDRPKRIAELMALANTSRTASIQARAALGRAHATEALPLLRRDVRSSDNQVREGAAFSLIEMGDFTHVASLVADDSAEVRAKISCAILARED